MRPEDRDLAYLWDMREAALDVMEFTKGIKYARFCSDKMLRYAVERRIEAVRRHDTYQKLFGQSIQKSLGLRLLGKEIFWPMNMVKSSSSVYGEQQNKIFLN